MPDGRRLQAAWYTPAVTARGSRLVSLLLALALGACASAKVRPAGSKVDLSAARRAVEAARKAGAPTKAPDAFKQAERHLREAESLASAKDLTPENSIRAKGLGELAVAQAHCSTTLARLATTGSERAARTTPEVERANTRSRKFEDDIKRLEERIALLLHDLEVTETEVIRTKARLKGIETKAEASSAIAEARILMGRLDAKNNAATLSLCEDSLAKAEKQLQQENYGAALFFAMKAQDAATKAQESPEARRPSPSPPN